MPLNSSSGLPDKIVFQFIVYYSEPPQTCLKTTHNAVHLAMNLLLSGAANTGVNQPITNLKLRISVSTNISPVKRYNLHHKMAFLLKCM